MKGLALLDMDGTLLSERTIDVLCEKFGKADELKEIDERAPGMLAFEVTQEIVRLFSGINRGEMERAFGSIALNPGVEDFLSFLTKRGFRPVIVTVSYRFLADQLAKRLNIDLVYGNDVEFHDETFTGKLLMRYPCMKIPNCRQHSLCKLRVLLELKKAFGGTLLAVGDSEADVCMVQGADIGVAYRPRSEALREVAKVTVSSFKELIESLGQVF